MELNLGVLTDEISDDLQLAIDTAKSWGISNIELHRVWGQNICHLCDADLSRALAIVRSSGMPVTCIDSLTLRCALDSDSEYSEHIAHMRRSIELARLFGTNMVRLFAFWKEPQVTDAVWQRIVTRLELPIRIAEREGITLGFENVSSGNIGSSADMKRLLDAFPSPALQVIWDPGNAYAARDELSAAEGYRLLRDRVVHVHVKDCDFHNGERRWLPVGAGKVDYVGFLRALSEDGYGGVIALETHYRPASGDAIEASRASLDGLLAAAARASNE
ncbi:sugar phosphate isomerase/epimerase [Candidatus Poribacteria bacterium]|nr:sugar phosphate isomerase/epimerase [Candidatus Poribacteria bacterium]